MNRSLVVLVAVGAGGIILFFLARTIIAEKAVPSLQDYFASSTVHLSDIDAALSDASSSVSLRQAVANLSGDAESGLLSIAAPTGTIHALVSADETAREKGLGDRDSLPSDEGMLFIFPQAGSYGFWMKDMSFPIDIVWMNAGHAVLGIASDVATSTYPDLFLPPSPVTYVLELNANAATNLGIVKGSILSFDPTGK